MWRHFDHQHQHHQEGGPPNPVPSWRKAGGWLGFSVVLPCSHKWGVAGVEWNHPTMKASIEEEERRWSTQRGGAWGGTQWMVCRDCAWLFYFFFWQTLFKSSTRGRIRQEHRRVRSVISQQYWVEKTKVIRLLGRLDSESRFVSLKLIISFNFYCEDSHQLPISFNLAFPLVLTNIILIWFNFSSDCQLLLFSVCFKFIVFQQLVMLPHRIPSGR